MKEVLYQMPPGSQKLYTYHYMNYATGIHADSQAFESRDILLNQIRNKI